MKLKDKRKITQIVAFAVSNLGFLRVLKTGFVCPFLYCYGCPFAAFGCPIGILQNFIVYGQFPFFAVGSLGVYGMIFGRAFCGWACPFGTLHDMLSPTNRRKEVKPQNYWYVKYAILFLTLALAWFALDTVFCKFCPSGSLFAAIPFRLLHPDATAFGIYFYIHMLTLALTIVLAILISRFWCRYLCPLGAIAGAFNKVGILTIRWDEEKCKKCNDCLDVCPMGITKTEDVGTSTDCTLCGRCVEACPEKALSFKTRG
ncbi:4Fe-4S binding protein [Candidatus Bathyarchaeota archaeon]|nr:4Fe-4S binding protein [Candidatus Bathyarchaeota archaeon]